MKIARIALSVFADVVTIAVAALAIATAVR
jgi:hypothetical protein